VPSGLLARAVIAAGAGCPFLTGTYATGDARKGKTFAHQMTLRVKPALAGAA